MEQAYAYDLHACGVHTQCTKAKARRVGTASGSWSVMPTVSRYDACFTPDVVEPLHYHDYDGPIVCCDDEEG